MIRDELKRLGTWEERHRRLVSRLLLVLILTAVIDGIGTALVYFFERSVKQTDIHTLFDAFFFTTVQLLTVSSQIKNPRSLPGPSSTSLRSLGRDRRRRIGWGKRKLLPDRRLQVAHSAGVP